MGLRAGAVLFVALFISFTFSSFGQFTHTAQLAPNYDVSWIIDQSTQQITMQLTAKLDHPAWLGIGWHPVGSSNDYMKECDFVIALFLNGTSASVSDYYSSENNGGFTRPVFDTNTPYPGGTNDILDYFGIQVPYTDDAGETFVMTSFTFRRYLVTNDTKADHPIEPGLMKVVWAHGAQNTFSRHCKDCKGQILINFFSGKTEISVTDTEKLKQMHGGLMFIASAILLTFGMAVPRYMKKYKWWFNVHFIVQTLGLSAMCAGFISILVSISKEEKDHFSGLHQLLGLITVILALILPTVTGLIARFVLKGRTAKFKVIHHWMGWGTVILMYIEVFLGVNEYGNLSSYQTPFYLLGILFGIYVIIVVTLEVSRWFEMKRSLSSCIPSFIKDIFGNSYENI